MDTSSSRTGKKRTPVGRYANSLRVGYNAYEFVFDFDQIYAREERLGRCIRIVTSPGHAKAMIAVLQSALEAFELDFGRIGGDREAAAEGSQSHNE